jgi:hypothetical protein
MFCMLESYPEPEIIAVAKCAAVQRSDEIETHVVTTSIADRH